MIKLKNELNKIKHLESDLLAKEGEILKTEQLVLTKEHQVEKDLHILKDTTLWLKHVETSHRRIIRRLSRHKFIFSMLVTFGVVLIWRGMWDLSELVPVLKDSAVALLVGFGILWFLEKYSEG